jgi:PAS domain S-box-containing protein
MHDPLRVLLIDDNDEDRSLIIHELRQRFGNLIYEQISALTALSDALERGAFDVAIMESQLRWTNGLNVLQDLKTRYPDRAAIMFTRYGDAEIAVAAMKAGLDDYLVKIPQHYALLPDVVQSALAQAAERRDQRAPEVHYRSLFARVPVGLFRTNPEGQILDANSALIQMLGYPDRETLLAVKAVDIYVHLEDRQRWQSLMEREGSVRDFEVQLRRHDGTMFWGRANTSVVRDVHHQVTYYEGMVEDITTHKEVEEVLRLLDAAVRRLDQLSPASTLPRPIVSTAEADLLRPAPATVAIDPNSPGSRGQPVDLLQRVRPKGFRQQQLNVRIDPALAERLRLFCAERRFKVLDIVTVALERLLEELETGQPRR